MDDKPFLYLATADEPLIGQVRDAALADFDINVFASIAECQAALASRVPTVLVLDTALPGGDAFALHRAVRDDFDTSGVRQLLLCTADEAGAADFVADDFLLRPATPALLLRKLKLVAASLAEAANQQRQLSYAQGVAMTAMTSMGDLGVVMDFLAKSFSCRSIQAVGALALKALEHYGLPGVIQLTWEGEKYAAETAGTTITPAEQAHIEEMRVLGRIHEIGRQLFVNFAHATIFIQEMPDDAARCGQIRDNIAILCEGIESRVLGLLLEHDNTLKQLGIRYAVCEIRDSVATLQAKQFADLATGRELIAHLTDEFEDAFMHMGISHEIENQLVGRLVDLRQRLSEVWLQPNDIDLRLRSVVGSLETLAGDITARVEAAPAEAAPVETAASGTIDLF